ncbi:unnamed protein product [Diatraea saccharalis]|uniref:Uncharacterized protein n=1 Tax=Diatraea saccharalis TaxID=40085 RepID=A0A9N9WDL6_9NEOP|nr:unnamed protein product [Diatraea saccharalis]
MSEAPPTRVTSIYLLGWSQNNLMNPHEKAEEKSEAETTVGAVEESTAGDAAGDATTEAAEGLLLSITQNADTSEQQNKEILKALKILESVINKNVTDEITVKPVLKDDILNFIHNLNPHLLTRPAVDDNNDNTSPLLQSREIIENNTKKNEEEEHRRFSIWLQNVFSDKAYDNKGINRFTLEKLIEHENKSPIDEGSEEMPESRRLMNWFRYIFQTPNRATTTPTRTDQKSNIDLNITDIKEKTQKNINQNNLTDVLDHLNHILTKINKNLEDHNSITKNDKGFIVLNIPTDLPFLTNTQDTNLTSRRKRELNNTIEKVVDSKNDRKTEADDYKNDTVSNTRRSFDSSNGFKIYQPHEVVGNENVNDYDKSVDVAKELKGNLISIVTDAFKDIKQKIGPIKTIKDKYLSDDMFIIGYIVACIDTLEITLTKLMAEMESKEQFWNEKQLMELFNKLNTSNKVIGRLMDSLHKYMMRLDSNYVI